MQQGERRTTSQTVHIGGQHKLNCKYRGVANYWLKECVFNLCLIIIDRFL